MTINPLKPKVFSEMLVPKGGVKMTPPPPPSLTPKLKMLRQRNSAQL